MTEIVYEQACAGQLSWVTNSNTKKSPRHPDSKLPQHPVGTVLTIAVLAHSTNRIPITWIIFARSNTTCSITTNIIPCAFNWQT